MSHVRRCIKRHSSLYHLPIRSTAMVSGADPAAVAYSASPSVPAFIAKLWALVEESTTDDVVRWSPTGESFIIYDSSVLSKALLPQYFKHNNYSSFIRQLNM